MTNQPQQDSDGLQDRAVLRVGDRFKLSSLGRFRCPRLAHKVGIVINLIEYSMVVIVRFDGNKTTTSINRNYVERLN